MQANSISNKPAYCQCCVLFILPCSENKTLICFSVLFKGFAQQSWSTTHMTELL